MAGVRNLSTVLSWVLLGCGSFLTAGCDRGESTEGWIWSRGYPVGHGPAALPGEMGQPLPASDARATVRGQLQALPARIPDAVVDARILVIATNGLEAELPALQQALAYMGTPFDVMVATTAPGLTPAQLAIGNHGKYNGIILTRGELMYAAASGPESAFSPEEWDELAEYEASFGVREAALYALPDGGYGLGLATAVDATVTPVSASCTTAGRAVFFDVNCDSPVSIGTVWTYPAPVRDAATTTALLVDASGQALASVQQLPGGREVMELSFGQTKYAAHSLQLLYGVVNWVTRGIFLGERQIYFGVQIDDLFIRSSVYKMPSTVNFRVVPADLQAAYAWQVARRQQPTTAQLRLDMAVNSQGTVIFAPDPLAAAAQDIGSGFKWINHTYDHADLTNLTYADALLEVSRNNARMGLLGLQPYSTLNLVTPGVSGLASMPVMQAIRDQGVRYVVTDTSQPGATCGVPNATCDNPSPNIGFYSPLQPEILMIPRKPTNLYYDVSTTEQWIAEYNDLYRATFGRDLSYDEILTKESDVLVTYLLKGEMDPWMFHQSNLRDIGSGHSLLTDLLDRTLAKYDARLRAPMVSPTMDELGGLMAARMGQAASGASATVGPGATITLHVSQAARVSVTGTCSHGSVDVRYAGQPIARVDVAPGTDLVLPIAGDCSGGGGGGAGGQVQVDAGNGAGGTGAGGSGVGGTGSGGPADAGAGGTGMDGAVMIGTGGGTGTGGLGMDSGTGGTGTGGTGTGGVGTGGTGTGGTGTGGTGTGDSGTGGMGTGGTGTGSGTGGVGTGGTGTGGRGDGGAMDGVGGRTGDVGGGGAAGTGAGGETGDGGRAGTGPGGSVGTGGALSVDAGKSDGGSALTAPGGGGCGCNASGGTSVSMSGLTLVGLMLVAGARSRRRRR